MKFLIPPSTAVPYPFTTASYFLTAGAIYNVSFSQRKFPSLIVPKFVLALVPFVRTWQVFFPVSTDATPGTYLLFFLKFKRCGDTPRNWLPLKILIRSSRTLPSVNDSKLSKFFSDYPYPHSHLSTSSCKQDYLRWLCSHQNLVSTIVSMKA